jgi:hypothetical protein
VIEGSRATTMSARLAMRWRSFHRWTIDIAGRRWPFRTKGYCPICCCTKSDFFLGFLRQLQPRFGNIEPAFLVFMMEALFRLLAGLFGVAPVFLSVCSVIGFVPAHRASPSLILVQ